MTPNILHRQAIGDLTTFRIPAHAERFVQVDSIAQLQSFLALQDEGPIFILGGGSNTIFCTDFPGTIIQYTQTGITVIEEDEHSICLRIAAGTDWHDVVMHAVSLGLGGIENLALIPGASGAAPIQNIGAYGVEFAEVFEQLTAVSVSDGSVTLFDKADCQFGYRDSVFKSSLKGQYVITDITLRLQKQPVFRLEYGAIKETLASLSVDTITPLAVAEAVMQIRRSKLPDPKVIANSGSFFKNPIIASKQAEQLSKTYPTMPQYATSDPTQMKVSAAWLIEQCGWKGRQLGGVGVYEKHALVLVNQGLGSGDELKQLVAQIQSDVKTHYQIELQPEVNLL